MLMREWRYLRLRIKTRVRLRVYQWECECDANAFVHIEGLGFKFYIFYSDKKTRCYNECTSLHLHRKGGYGGFLSYIMDHILSMSLYHVLVQPSKTPFSLD